MPSNNQKKKFRGKKGGAVKRLRNKISQSRNLATNGMSAPSMASRSLGVFSLREATPFPSRFRTSMEYAEVIQMTTGTTADTFTAAEISVRLNSLYQPRATATQPLGFSTLAGIYARYRVDRVRIYIRFHFATAAMWALAAVVPPSSTYSTNAITINQALRNPFIATVPLAPDSVSTKQSFVEFQKEFSCAQLVGVTKQQYEMEIDKYCGTDTTTPSAGFIPYLLINASNQGGSTAQTVKVDLKIVFDCVWFERDVLAT